MPASVPFAYAAHVVAVGFDIARTDLVFTKKVLPHEQHFHL